MEISARDIQDFVQAIHDHFGLQFEAARHDELIAVLRERVKEVRAPSVREYLEMLSASPAEWQNITSRLTVPETYFFRSPEQLEAFTSLVIPERMRAREGLRMLRFASLGCASGEEPYSLAMALRERHPDLDDWEVDITGYDISRKALEKARHAVYREWSLRTTSDDRRRRYFRHAKDGFHLRPEITAMVRFQRANILDLRMLPAGSCDAVFFRNVLIYFSPASARTALRCISHLLAPGGYLFLGTAENLRGISHDYALMHTHGAFYYRRREKPGAAEGIETWPEIYEEAAQADAEIALAPAPLPLGADTTWVDLIQASSERIGGLAKSAAGRRKPSRTVSERARAVQEAMQLLAQERFVDGLKALERVPPPEADADVHVLRAVLLTNSGNIAEAKRACEQVLGMDDLNAGAHYLMALCREQEGDTAGAVEQAQMAAYLDPAFAMPHLHQAMMERRCGRAPDARRLLEHARALLAREDAARLLLFGGGFTREGLIHLCERELLACGGPR
jgi:chemotaxis protein methyltransferase CheR